MSKVISNGIKAKKKIIEGINLLADTVKTTLGPNGKYVIIDQEYGSPIITNDGVTVAKEISLKDKEKNLGAKLIIEASEKTDNNVGDGTTTTAIVTQGLINEGSKIISLDQNFYGVIKGIQYAKDQVIEYLETNCKEIKGKEDLTSVATISSNSKQIGEKIASLLEKVGQNGIATIEEGSGFDTEIDVIEGMHFDKGFAAPFMVTDKKAEIAEYERPLVFIYEDKLDDIRRIVPILELIVKEGRTLVVIAKDFSEEFLSTLFVNSLQGGLKVLAIKTPGSINGENEDLIDIAIYTQTKIYKDSNDIKSIEISDLGVVKKIKSFKDKTIIFRNSEDNPILTERIDLINDQIKVNSKSEHLKKRLAKLVGGIGVLKVGASTESELKNKKYKYEDALNSAIAAKNNGVVEGGGLSLIKATQNIKLNDLSQDEKLGVEIVKKAFMKPFHQIIDNCGENGAIIYNNLKNKNFEVGYDASQKIEVDMFEKGIIDPTNIVKNVVSNSISIATLVLSTNSIITEEKEK